MTMLVVGFATAGLAQNKKSGWGIKGGMNFPMDGFSINQAGQNVNSIFTSQSHVNGWHAGVYGRAYASKKLYFGSSLMYINNENKLSGKTGDGDFNKTFATNAAQLDAVMGVRMFKFLRLQGGVNGLAYLNNDFRQTFDTFGAGYTFGVGIDLWRIGFDLNYNTSFKDQTGTWNNIPLHYNRSDLMLSMSIKL